MELNDEKLQNYIDSLNANVTEFASITNQVVAEQSSDLDELMEAIRYSVTQEDAISTDAVERYYAELSNFDISQDLSMGIGPAVIDDRQCKRTAYGVQYVLTF